MPVWENRERVQRDIGSMIDLPVFYEHLSARENLGLHQAYMQTNGNINGILKSRAYGHQMTNRFLLFLWNASEACHLPGRFCMNQSFCCWMNR